MLVSHETKGRNDSRWILDSGCSNHLSGNKDAFLELDESFRSSIKLGDDHTIPVLGKGRIAIKLNNGSSNYIPEMYYAPSICQNC